MVSLVWIPPVNFPKFTPRLEYRERYENRNNRDFDNSVTDRRHDYLSRLRIGGALRLSPQWDGEAVFQMADDEAHPEPKSFVPTTRNASTAFVRYAQGDLTITGGRQLLTVGNQRMIGVAEWGNVGRYFDAVRVQKGAWDLWAGAVGVSPIRIRDARVAALTRSHATGSTSLIFKHDESTKGDIDHFTLHRSEKLPWRKGNIQLDGALQAGHVEGRSLQAWAFSVRTEQSASPKLTLNAEFNIASGGGTSGTTRTFDCLYPNEHADYGTIDIQSWRNVVDLAIGARYRPMPKWSVYTMLHSFALQDKKDAWYGLQGLANRRGSKTYVDPTGKSGGDIGRELDFEVSYAPTKQITYLAGVGVFDPGRFVHRVGGGHDQQVWAFASVAFKL